MACARFLGHDKHRDTKRLVSLRDRTSHHLLINSVEGRGKCRDCEHDHTASTSTIAPNEMAAQCNHEASSVDDAGTVVTDNSAKGSKLRDFSPSGLSCVESKDATQAAGEGAAVKYLIRD